MSGNASFKFFTFRVGVNLKARALIDVIIFIFLYAYSYILISNYISGDQEHYRKLYELFSDANFTSIFLIAPGVIGSSEPISLFILWLGSVLSIDKDIYISFWNAILLFGFLKLSQKNRLGVFFGILLLTNFYVVILLTGVERLKFAFIFIIYYYLFFEKKFLSVSLLGLAVLSHFQTLLFIFGLGAYSSLNFLKPVLLRAKIKFYTLGLLVFTLACTACLFHFFGDTLLDKGQAYIQDGSLISLINLFFLLVVALLSTRNRANMAVMIVAFFPVVYVLGGERVNMVVFMLVLLKLMAEGRANQPVFMVLMTYFTVKSFGFVYNIFVYGNGFYA